MALTYRQLTQPGHRTHRSNVVRRRTAATAEENPVLRKPDSAAQLISLQHNYGNQHVQRRLAIQRDTKATGGIDEKDILGDAVFGGSVAVLFKVPAVTMVSTSSLPLLKINREGEAFLKRMTGLGKSEKQWQAEMDHLLLHHRGHGPSQLKIIQDSSTAIGKSVTGKAGEYTRKVIDEYLAELGKADGIFNDIPLKQKAVERAVSEVHTRTLEKKQTDANRETKKIEGEIETEKKRVEKQELSLETMFGLAKKAFDPEEWAGLATDAALYIGQKAIDAIFTNDKLEGLEKKLTEAQDKATRIEDETHKSRIKTATIDLTIATEALDVAKKNFLTQSRVIRAKEVTVIETLRNSKSTKAAAGAIAERGDAVETAHKTLNDLKKFSDEVDLALNVGGELRNGYQALIDNLANPNQSSATNDQHRRTIEFMATQNRKATVEMMIWLSRQTYAVRDTTEILAQGDFYEGYQDIPNALQQAEIGRIEPKTQ